jgi:hypothetical protein
MATSIDYPSAQLPRMTRRFRSRKNPGVKTTKFATGRVRQRNPYDDYRRAVDLEFEFTQRELDLFTGWFSYTCNNGASSFNIELYLDADDYQTYEVLPIEGKFSSSYFGVGYYRVTLPVLVRDALFVSAEVVELFQFYGDSFESMLAAGDELDIFVNQTLPPNFQLYTV